jgi:hypothetical protein
MMVGFRFPHGPKDHTPYDFVSDEKTGLRPGTFNNQKPSGFAKVDLTNGIMEANIPPVFIWAKGDWLLTLVEENVITEGMMQSIPAHERFDSWVCSGEGTPGNFLYRVYVLPDEISRILEPKHPMLWPKALQEPKPKSIYTAPPRSALPGGYGYAPTPAKKAAPKTPTMPAGIRFRCPGCGHWWAETKLAPHTNFCCPGKQGFTVTGVDEMLSDFAIQCECCATLDQVGQCKPGYPRPAAVKAADDKPDEEVKPDETPAEKSPEPVAAATA